MAFRLKTACPGTNRSGSAIETATPTCMA